MKLYTFPLHAHCVLLLTVSLLYGDQNAIKSIPTTRYYYVHHDQLKQQLLQVTGTLYNGASMNLSSLYETTVVNGNVTMGSLVNSSTCGNVTLGSLTSSATMSNLTFATLIAQMQSYAYLTATSLTTFTISSQSPNNLISTDGTNITFNTAGTYLLFGSFVGTAANALSGATLTLTDSVSGVTSVTYSIPSVTTSGTSRFPTAFAYSQIYSMPAGATLSFSKSGNWTLSATATTLCIVRII